MKVYQLLGDIELQFDDSHLKYSEESYHRELDLDNATAKIKYNVGDMLNLPESILLLIQTKC